VYSSGLLAFSIVGCDMSEPVIQYTSRTARFLAWLVFCPPFNWIGNMQSRVSTAQLKQIFEEYDAQPISVSLIFRGPQISPLWIATPSDLDGSK